LDKLPSASVVILFTNEAWSPLLRTVHSVINRTPPKLLHEIVLLDDSSDHRKLLFQFCVDFFHFFSAELKEPLEKYIKRFGPKVKLYRETERQGIVRGRLAGAKRATGQVVVFLDSHCEANHGWLEPIVSRIGESRTAMLVPAIDHISDTTMQYSGGGGVSSVGTFWWSLHFRWDPIPASQAKNITDVTKPVR
jgi:polypeptide N-acetylgalactosaminyltransferase